MFQKYERVLVRDQRHHAWRPALYWETDTSEPTTQYPYRMTVGDGVGQYYRWCIKWDETKVDQITAD